MFNAYFQEADNEEKDHVKKSQKLNVYIPCDRLDLGRYLEDIDSLIEYMKSLNGEVPKDYADVGGQGRIRITE